jgi:hypothetical protein
MKSQPSPLDDWISNGNANIDKRYKNKTYTNSLPLIKDHILSQKWMTT